MIIRRITEGIIDSLDFFPVVAITGPRQVGKTTLAKYIISHFKKPSIYLDLELQSDFNKLNDAELFLSEQTGKLVVIDEVQHKKELYPLLRALVDKGRVPGMFLLLGSASPDLLRDSSESLAGRITYHQLSPFNLTEIPDSVSQNALWLKGGFPNMILARNSRMGYRWMDSFISIYLSRDLIELGLNASPRVIRNLWTMLAHQNGQLFNATTIGNSLGVTTPTVKRYVDFLEDAFLIRSLYPFSGNIKKRLVRTPRIYLTDTGILHHLTGVTDFIGLSGNQQYRRKDIEAYDQGQGSR